MSLMGFRGDHTKMCHSGTWIILSWKETRLKRFRKNRWTSPLLLKEFKREGLFQEVALTIDDYRKVCTQWHREEPAAAAAAAAAKSLQSCPTLCDPIDSSPLGSAVPGILQARILEWVAIPFSNAWKWKVKVKSLSRVQLFETPMDRSLPGSSVHGIFQARVLEWGAIAFSVFSPKKSVVFQSAMLVCQVFHNKIP